MKNGSQKSRDCGNAFTHSEVAKLKNIRTWLLEEALQTEGGTANVEPMTMTKTKEQVSRPGPWNLFR